MLFNNLKAGLRHFRQTRLYGLLNLFGLTIGIVCAGLIFLWIEDEMNFDGFAGNRDRVYMVKNKQKEGNSVVTVPYTPGPLGPAIKAEVPGVSHVSRVTLGMQLLCSTGEKNLYETGRYVDPDFFQVFPDGWKEGSAKSAFEQPQSVVISEKMAKAFFGAGHAYGQTLLLDKKVYTVRGVLADLPQNISVPYDLLLPFSQYELINPSLQGWGNQLVTWVEVDPSANLATANLLIAKIPYEKVKIENETMELYPLSRIHLYNRFDDGGHETGDGNIRYVRMFTLIGWIILAIACINFMNLATARSEKRGKEVGVRKVMGASKSSLIGQFAGESVLLSLIATLAAVLLIAILLPAFNQLVGKQIVLNLFEPQHILGIAIITLFCGFLAGSYPAFYLSAFNPVAILKSAHRKGREGLVRKLLVMVQFGTTVVFIIASVVIYRQLTYTRQRDLGFKRDNLITMVVQGGLKKSFGSVKNQLITDGAIEDASLSLGTVLEGGYSSDGFNWPKHDPSKPVLISFELASPEYIHTMGMRISAGQDFDPVYAKDSNRVIINETLARMLQEKNPVGTVLTESGKRFTVVGVIHDFSFGNVFQTSAPFLMFVDTSQDQVLTMRVKNEGRLETNLAKISAVLKTANPGYPFNYQFVDEEFNAGFRAETLTGRLAGLFALLAVSISCIGLFGLAAYTAERRTKEIGIRKVLGASVAGVTGMLSRDFLLLAGISCLIAFPVAGWLMHAWLQGYYYRVSLNWWLFAGTGVLVVLIALLTVGAQAVRAALANPVRSLRSE
jgi:predicted permease